MLKQVLGDDFASLGLLRPKQARRFYEPLILYQVLSEQQNDMSSVRQPSIIETDDSLIDLEQDFNTYVYKLSHACSKRQGRDYIISFAIMKQGDRMLYAFACNHVSESKGFEIVHYVKDILRTVNGTSTLSRGERTAVKEAVLSRVVLFNRPRIATYLSCMRDFIRMCCNTFDRVMNEEGTTIAEALSV
jgi:hypothetical protein